MIDSEREEQESQEDKKDSTLGSVQVTYNEITLNIPVHEEERAQVYYQAYLKIFFQQFYPFLEKLSLPLDRSALCTDLLTNLATLLDQRVIFAMCSFLESRVSDKKVHSRKPTNQEIESSLKKTPLKDELHYLADLTYRHALTALRRFDHDFKSLQSCFLENLQEDVYLRHLHIASGERHRMGQQVYILEFADGAGGTKKVVYKPAPLVASALLIGDMKRLQEKKIDSRWNESLSLMNIFNDYLEEKGEEPLESYIILPCRDQNEEGEEEEEEKETTSTNSKASMTFQAQYGYMEYIKHEPWEEPNYLTLFQRFIKEFPTNDSALGYQEAVQSEVDCHFQVLFQKAIADSESDYIIRNPDEVIRYSRDCGLLAALLLATGTTDMHQENLIIRQRRPILIDTELCFNFIELKLAATICLDIRNGAMHSRTKTTERLNLFNGDLYSISVKHFTRNSLFSYDANQKCVTPVSLNEEEFIKGYRLGLACFVEKNDRIQSWLAQNELQRAVIRIIPMATEDFETELIRGLCDNFSKQWVSDIKRSNRILFKDKYLMEKKQFPDKEYFPDFVIYDETNVTYIFKEYRSLSIPWYYAIIDGQNLFNGEGVLVQLQGVEGRSQFFSKTPESFITDRLQKIASMQTELEQLLENEKTEGLRIYILNIPVQLDDPLDQHTTRLSSISHNEGQGNSETSPLISQVEEQTEEQEGNCCTCRPM